MNQQSPRKIKSGILSCIILSAVITVLFSISGCKKGEVTPAITVDEGIPVEGVADRYSVLADGLQMYELPDVNSNKIEMIVFGEKIKALSEQKEIIFVAGEYGKWTKITWKDKTGWVFGGYLRSYDINVLKKTAANYYNKLWKKYCDDWFKEHGEGVELTPEISRFYTQTDKDIIIKMVAGDYAVVRHSTSDQQGDVTDMSMEEKRDDLWIYQNNKWREVPMPYFVQGADANQKKVIAESLFVPGGEPVVKNAKIALFYMNEDNFPDYVVSGGCCDSISFYPLIGQENKKFKLLGEYTGVDAGEETYEVVPDRCGKKLVRYLGDDEKDHVLIIDCKTNKIAEI